MTKKGVQETNSMTDKRKHARENSDEPEQNEPHDGDGPDGDPAAQENQSAWAEPSEADPVAALQAETAELKDRLLRAMAEMDNVRKRAEREKAEATLYAATSFARDLLPVVDSLDRALESVPQDNRDKLDEATRNLVAGIEVTQKELLNVFARHGIRQLQPAGERFDPHFHQAMFEVPDGSVPAGTVVQVMQTGYTIGERCLRPAMVGVAKAPAGAPPTGDGSDEARQAGRG